MNGTKYVEIGKVLRVINACAGQMTPECRKKLAAGISQIPAADVVRVRHCPGAADVCRENHRGVHYCPSLGQRVTPVREDSDV